MPKLLSTLRSLANAFLGKTGKPDRVDTATRMAMDAGSGRGKPSAPERESAEKVGPIDELKRIIGEQDTEPRATSARPVWPSVARVIIASVIRPIDPTAQTCTPTA